MCVCLCVSCFFFALRSFCFFGYCLRLPLFPTSNRPKKKDRTSARTRTHTSKHSNSKPMNCMKTHVLERVDTALLGFFCMVFGCDTLACCDLLSVRAGIVLYDTVYFCSLSFTQWPVVYEWCSSMTCLCEMGLFV